MFLRSQIEKINGDKKRTRRQFGLLKCSLHFIAVYVKDANVMHFSN